MFEKKQDIKSDFEIKKTKKKTNTYIPFYIAVSLIVVVATVAMFSFVFFKVEYIEASSTDLYSSQQILDASGIHKGDNLVFMNTEAIEDKIFHAFPYVDSVDIKISLPSTVQITVTEASAYYSVGYSEGYALVSATGKLLEKVSEPQEGTALINAGEIRDVNGMMQFIDDKTQDYLVDIMGTLANREEGEITEIDLSNIHDIKIIYQDRIIMDLGSANDLAYKIRFGYQIIDGGYILDDEIGVLDLSFGRDVNRAFFTSNGVVSEFDDDDVDDDTNDTSSENETSSKDDSSSSSKTESSESDRGNDIPDF